MLATAAKPRHLVDIVSSLRDEGNLAALGGLKPTAINFNGYAIFVSQRLLLIAVVLLAVGFYSPTTAQTPISEEAFITKALEYNPAARASALSIEQSLNRQGTAYGLPDLLVNTESPTGNFYAVGVLQSFRLPGYYGKQRRLLKAETGAVTAQANLTRIEVLLKARQLYLQAQYYQSLDSLLNFQDSLYRTIASAAQRLYKAGQTDVLQSYFAATQASEVAISRQANSSLVLTSQRQLQVFAGFEGPVRVQSLFKANALVPQAIIASDQSPTVQLARQNALVAKAVTASERARFKPTISVGYLNQGPRETPQAYRLRGGVDIPIWTRAYSASIKAARVGERIAERNLEAQRQGFRLDSIQLSGQRERLAQSIARFERELVPQSDQIISASTRLRQVGNIDVIAHLRTVNDAFGIKLRYLDLLRQWRETQISTNALSGAVSP